MKFSQSGLALLATAAITMLIVIITVSIGADILDTIQDSQTAGSYAFNSTNEGLKAFGDLAEWFPTIAIVLAAVVVIGLVMLFRTVRQ